MDIEQIRRMAEEAEKANSALEQIKKLQPFRHEIERLNDIMRLREIAGAALTETVKTAIESATSRSWEQRIMESLRPDFSRFDAMMKQIKPIAQQRSEGFHSTIKRQIQELQKSLAPDKELLIYHHTGLEIIRILHIATPDWETVVLTGVDENGNPSKVIASIHSVQFVCKVVDVPPQQKRIVGFSAPEEKEPTPANVPIG